MRFFCLNEVIYANQLHVRWKQGGWLIMIGRVKMGYHLDGYSKFFHEFPFETVESPFTELKTSAGKFGHVDTQAEFVRHQHLIIIEQEAVYANVELVRVHLTQLLSVVTRFRKDKCHPYFKLRENVFFYCPSFIIPFLF